MFTDQRIIIFALLFFSCTWAHAVVRTTSGDGDLHTAGNWDCICLPGIGDTVEINHNMTTSAALTIYEVINVNSGGTITQNAGSGRILRSNGNLTIKNGGRIDILGTADYLIVFGDFEVEAGGILDSDALIDIFNGAYQLDGTQQGNSLTYLMAGSTVFSGTGTRNDSGSYQFQGNRTIASTTDIDASGTKFIIFNAIIVTNQGTMYVDSIIGTAAFVGNFTNDATGTVYISGGIRNLLTFDVGTAGNTVVFNRSGTSTQTIHQALNNEYQNLTIDGTTTAGEKTLGFDIDILGDLTITSNGNMNSNSNDINLYGDFTMNGDFDEGTGEIIVQGTGQQVFGGTGEWDVYDLTISNTSDTVKLNVKLDVGNDIDIDASAIFDASGDSVYIEGDFTQDGEFIPGLLTVMDGSSAPASVVSGTGTLTVNDFYIQDDTDISINLDVNGDFWIFGGNVLDLSAANTYIAGDFFNLGDLQHTFGGLTMDGTSKQVIAFLLVDSIGALTISNPDTVYIVNHLVVKGKALTISASGVFDCNNRTLHIGQRWSNNGTFVQREGHVRFYGAQTFNIQGITTFYDLEIDKSSNPVNIFSGRDSIQNSLILTNGTFNTNDSLIFISNANGTAYIPEITGGEISGEIVYQNYIDAGATNWRFMTTPVAGADLEDWDEDFITSGFTGTDYPDWQDPLDPWPSMYYYREVVLGAFENGWTAPTNTNTVIDTGQGYAVWCGDTITGTDPFTIDLRGEADTGDINMPVFYNTLDFDPALAGWNLVGNPYPAPIWWKDADWTKTNIDDAIYIWDPDAEQYASYVAGVGSNGGTGYIAPSQAFWIKANGASPRLMAREGVKYDSTTVGFKSNTTPKVLRLKLSGNGHLDETVFRFEDDATENFDGQYDAYKMYSYNWEAPSLASLMDTIDYSINSLPLNEDLSIPLLVYVGATKSYTFSVEGLDELGLNSCIVLEDRETGTFVDLRTTPDYTVTIPYTIATPRFYLHVSRPLEASTASVSCHGLSDGVAIAQGLGAGPWDYTWYDAEDNVIASSTGLQTADTLFSLPAGTYTVSIGNGSGHCVSSEVELMVPQPQPLAIEADHATESCLGEEDGWITPTVGGGTPPYSYIWSNGSSEAALTGLESGTYEVSVTDSKGCIETAQVILSAPGAIVADFEMSSQHVVEGEEIVFTNNSEGGEHYTWDFGNGEYSASEAPLYAYFFAGDYVVMLSVESGPCFELSKQKVSVSSPITAVDAAIVSPLRVELYPNPAAESDRVFLRMEELGMEEVLVVVTDLLGRQWYSKVIVTNGNGTVVEAIDVDGSLPSGTYLVTGSSVNELFSKRLIIR